MKCNRRRYLGALTSAAVVALAGCAESESDDFEDGGGDGSGSSDDIELLEHEAVREDAGTSYETLYVRGKAKNTSGSELDYAEVEVKFYEGDSLAESFLDNINGWSAGETWQFEVMYPSMGEKAAKITDYQIRAGTSL